MAKIANFASEMSEKITTLVGYPLQAGWIVHDDPGFHYYIRNLRPGYPICVMDYHVMPGRRPELMLVLPYADYRRLEKVEYSVEEYLTTAHFSFGYYWGGGSVLGAYWQPLEAESGIHDTERIKRYLWQMACRTYVHSLGHDNPAELCASCPLKAETCPHSALVTNSERCWKSEISEFDGRVKLFNALIDRISAELRFGVRGVLSHTGAKDILELYAGYEPESVQIRVSQELLNDLLYHPEPERNWGELARSLRLVRRRRDSDVAAEIDPEMQDKRTSCLMFWGSEMPLTPKPVVTNATDEGYRKGIRTRLGEFFFRKLGVTRNIFAGKR